METRRSLEAAMFVPLYCSMMRKNLLNVEVGIKADIDLFDLSKPPSLASGGIEWNCTENLGVDWRVPFQQYSCLCFLTHKHLMNYHVVAH